MDFSQHGCETYVQNGSVAGEKMPLGVCSSRFRSQKLPFSQQLPSQSPIHPGCLVAIAVNMDVYAVHVHVPAGSGGRVDEESRWVKIELYHDVSA